MPFDLEIARLKKLRKQLKEQAKEQPTNGGRGKSAQNTAKAAREGGGQENERSTSNQDSKEAVGGGEVIVTGNEFGEYKDIKELRKKAKQYYKEHLQGTTVENPILGEVGLDNHEIEFTRAGLGKMGSTSAKEHKLLLVAHLPDLIRSATRITKNDNVKNKRDASQFSYLHTEAVIDGKPQPVTITIFTDVNGNKYYNHILPTEEHGGNTKDPSVPPAQATQNDSGIPAIDGSSVDSSIPQQKSKRNEKVGSFSVGKTGKKFTATLEESLGGEYTKDLDSVLNDDSIEITARFSLNLSEDGKNRGDGIKFSLNLNSNTNEHSESQGASSMPECRKRRGSGWTGLPTLWRRSSTSRATALSRRIGRRGSMRTSPSNSTC